MRIENQRLRNLTTGRLHTGIECVYEDLELIIGESGLMTHMLPNAMRAVEYWLRERVTDQRFWDGELDPRHLGVTTLPDPTGEERREMLARYSRLPSPLAGKEVIVANLGS
jgi:hypothetical protein